MRIRNRAIDEMVDVLEKELPIFLLCSESGSCCTWRWNYGTGSILKR